MASHTRKIVFLASQVTLLCLTSVLIPRAGLAQTSPAGVRKLAAETQSQSAIAALKRQGNPAIKTLIQLARDEKEPQKNRIFAIVALGELNARSAIPVLSNLVSASPKAIRLAALDAFTKIENPGKEAVAAQVTALKDKDTEIKIAAAQALTNAGTEASLAITDLISALADPNLKVRVKAVDAIAAAGSQAKPAIAALMDTLSSQEREFKKAAVIALSKLGQDAKPAVPILAQLLADPDSEIREIGRAHV